MCLQYQHCVHVLYMCLQYQHCVCVCMYCTCAYSTSTVCMYCTCAYSTSTVCVCMYCICAYSTSTVCMYCTCAYSTSTVVCVCVYTAGPSAPLSLSYMMTTPTNHTFSWLSPNDTDIAVNQYTLTCQGTLRYTLYITIIIIITPTNNSNN